MTRLLCWLGFHRWGAWHRRSSCDDGRVTVSFCYCLRCMAKQSRVL